MIYYVKWMTETSGKLVFRKIKTIVEKSTLKGLTIEKSRKD